MNRSPDAQLDDRLGPLEPDYKSRGETQVGRLLDHYGLPFFYEQPTLIYDRGRHRIWRPDFNLPSYGGLVIEYAGMPEVPEYAAGIRHKQRAYPANGITALFVYPNDLQGRDWPERLAQRIRRAGELAVSRHRPFSEPCVRRQRAPGRIEYSR